MGQAQSQSGDGNGCEGCFPGGFVGYGYVPGVPTQPRAPSEVHGARLPTVGAPTLGIPGVSVPGVGIPGVGVQGLLAPGVGPPGVGPPRVGPPGVGVPGERAPLGIPSVGAPGVGVPGVGVPGVGVPGVGAPGLGIPGVGVPGVGVPGVGAPIGVPSLGAPGVGVPGVGAPIGIPGFGVPGVGVPGVEVPSVGAPGVGPPGIGVPGVGIPTRVPGVPAPIGLPGVSAPGVGVSGILGAEAPIGISRTGVGAPGVGVGVPGVGVGVPGVGVGVGVGLGVGVGVGVGLPGVEAHGLRGVTPVGVPGVGAPSVTGVGPLGVPGLGVPGLPGVTPVGVPSLGVPGVGVPGLPGVTPVGVPSVGAPGLGALGLPGVTPVGIPSVGAPGLPGVTPVGVPSAGVPGVGAPGAPIMGVPSTGYPVQVAQGVGVPGGIPGVGVPGGIPGVGVPGGIPGIGITGGVPSVGIQGGLPVGVQGGVHGLGVPGVAGVATPAATVYQPGPYQQPAIVAPAQVGYPGGIYQQLGGGVYTGQEAYYTAAGDSQAESSVRQEDQEIRAAASAQGKYGGGTAQTQVSGIYSGTGAFSAQAQTSDKDRGAQSQVVGGKDGATSTAQGLAGSGKTQSQVQMGSSNGATTAEAQSGGTYYGANTQVQAGYQGGMADAQAKGQGSTSSQAQIGFTPYQKNSTTNGQKSPFRGGGSALAQGGVYSGQSQSQIQGSFLHGISYTGAAQAGSGQTTYSRTGSSNYEDFGGKLGLVQSGSRDGIPQNGGGVSTATGQPTQYQPFGSLNNNPLSSHTNGQQQTHERGSIGQEVANLPHHSDQRRDYDETTIQPDVYTDTETRSHYRQTNNLGGTRNENDSIQQGGNRIQTHGTRRNDTGHTRIPTQTQHIVLGPLNGRGAQIIQDSDDEDQYSPGDILQPGQTIHGTPEYTIPKGYRGRITSVAGPQKTAAQGGQSQTVVISPGAGNVTYTNPSVGYYQPPVMSIPVGQQSVEEGYDQSSQSVNLGNGHTQLRNGRQQSVPTRWNGSYSSQRNGRTSRNGNNIRNGQSLNTYHHPTPDSFVTVTKSVTGQLDNGKASNAGKYTHTYYTKSSTCGYFTFSCNIVFGSNGRTKICRPNPPTTPDGTPCCC